MAAASLPTELLQLVYNFLDPRDFYSARQVCRWWCQTSNDIIALSKQVNNLPITQSNDSAVRQDLNWYRVMFDKATYINMMGMRLEELENATTEYIKKSNKSKFAVSLDGSRLAALDSGLLTVYDTTMEDLKTVHEQPTNSYKWMLGPGPWFKSAPNACFELAISADRSVVAIALERTIQIYKLGVLTTAPVSKWLVPACGDYVVGVEFSYGDRLLRLQLSKGHVVYLGQPDKDESDTFAYWQSATHQVYLDSAHIQFQIPYGEANTVFQPHHLRLFPEAATDIGIPFIVHPEDFAPFLYYTGFCNLDGSDPCITGAVPAQWCPLLPRQWFEWLPAAFPHVCTRDTRTALSSDGRLFAVWDPDFTTTAQPSGRVHLCRWPAADTATKLTSLQEDEVGTIYHFPSHIGRVGGKIMNLMVETSPSSVQTGNGEEVYKLSVRTDEQLVSWDVKLPALVE